MAKEPPIYDLMLLLSTNAEDEQRNKILADVQASISSAGGSIERDDDWGRRPLAYEIRHQPEAEYHLLQFRAPPTLIDELSHTLRITDGVTRFRVIKVRPGTPPAPSSPPPVVVAATSSGHPGAASGAGDASGTDPSSSSAPAASPTAEPPGESEPPSQAGSTGEPATPSQAGPSSGPESSREATGES